MGKKVIRDRDLPLIKEVLDEYGIKDYKIDKIRSAYKVKTGSDLYCLKKLKHGRTKSQMGNAMVGHLYNNNFPFVPKYLTTEEGQLYVEKEGHSYYMIEWIDGKEAGFKKKEVLLEGVRLLGKFHKASMKFDGDEHLLKDNFIKNKTRYTEDIEKLRSFQVMLQQGKKKTKWEAKYESYISYFLNKAEDSLRLFEAYNYDILMEKDRKSKGFCHESYYYQNIIIDKEQKYYIIDLDSSARNIYMYDLGKFLRRMMWAKEYGWDFNVVKECIHAYNQIMPIGKMEIGILFGILIFPHKFIKLGNKWIEKKEKWDMRRYMRKLDKQIELIPNLEKFIQQYREHYNISR